MSKTSKRKSTETGKQTSDTVRTSSTFFGSSTINKETTSASSQSLASSLGVKRPSVFDRLGTKAASSRSSIERSLSVNTPSLSTDSYCRSWAQNGTCSYDKSCKLAHSHALISPSKRSSSGKKDAADLHTASSVSRRQLDEEKGRQIPSGKHQSPEVNSWENWDQTELEYEDEKVLEKRRAALQRELELQMKKEGSNKKILTKASRSSSTSSVSSSSVSSSTSTSSSSVGASNNFDTRKRRDSSSSAESDSQKTIMKSSSHKDSPVRKSSSSARDASRKSRSSGSVVGTSPSRRKRSSSRKSSPKSKASTGDYKGAATDYKGITLEVTLKNDLALRANPKVRRDSPLRQSGSTDGRNRRSNSRGRRRSPAARASVSRRSRPRSPRPTTSSRARTPERKKDIDRKKNDRSGRKGAYREKKDSHDDARGRVKARELREREMAREKERLEALERCRERQRERELKEKERLREERDRKDTKRSSREMSRPSVVLPDKRHDRAYEKFDRGKGSERERSYERERVRDRGLDRVLDRKSIERGGRERSRSRFGDRANYGDSRRMLQQDDKNYSSSPYRGSEKGRYESDRERLSPRDDRLNRSNYDDRRDRDRGRNWPADRQQSSQSSRYDEPSREREKPPRSSGGNDWSSERNTDFQDASSSRNRDWETSRIRDEGSEDWSGYDRAGGGDWHGNRQLPHHRVMDDRRNLRHGSGSKDKEVHPPVESNEKELDALTMRSGVGDECEEPVKRLRPSEPPALDNVSDISDDPDDILNRDDIEFTEGEDSRLGESSQNAVCDTSSGQGERAEGAADDSLLAHSPNTRIGEDENIVGLDFEEISDEELEEESKMNKGGTVGDALGVDWASLIADCRPAKKKIENGDGDDRSSVRARWEASNMLARLGVSTTLASADYVKKLKDKYPEILIGGSTEGNLKKVVCVAALQRKMAERKARRQNVIALSMENKQALSARADIAIRRRLCGLPVVSLETHSTTGFCPWAL